MADVIPVRGHVFDSQKVDISESLIRQELFTSGFVKGTPLYSLIFDENKNAREVFNNWIKLGIVRKLEGEGFLIHKQRFEFRGKILERVGLIALLRVTPFEEGIVYPHEKTFRESTQIHLKLMERTGMNFDQVLLLYEDRDKSIRRFLDESGDHTLLFQFKDHLESQHTVLWTKSDDLKKFIGDFFSGEKFVIADGHHRYEASVKFKEKMRSRGNNENNSPWNFRIVNLINTYDDEVVALPTHRYVSGVDESQIIKELEGRYSLQECSEGELENIIWEDERNAIGLVTQDRIFILNIDEGGEEKSPGVTVLHSEIFPLLKITEDRIKYFRNVNEAIYKVSKEGGVVFCLKPISPLQVRKFALSRKLLPPKTTDFFPKLVVGLVFYNLLQGE